MHKHNEILPLIQASVYGRSAAMLEWTQKLCNINSGSWNVPGIMEVNQQLEALFADVVDRIEHVPLAKIELVKEDGDIDHLQTAPALVFHINESAPVKILCTGHSDTVFSKHSAFQSCWQDGDLLRGPGTADMKGGLVVLHESIRALMQSELSKNIGITICISPDEEIGSPSSASLLADLASKHNLGMTYEPALADGTLAGQRKGSGNFSLVVRGKSTHAGREFYEGRNAVVAAAIAAEKLSQLSDSKENITLNIGSIRGGGAVNVVPDFAIVRFNIRIETASQMESVNSNIQNIIACVSESTACNFNLHGGFNRPPKIFDMKHQKLYHLLEKCGQELSIPIAYKSTGGCCEGNNLAAAGLANIDTLGVRGANIHSEDEYACIDSFEERAKLSALLMARFTEQQLLAKNLKGGKAC